MIIDYLTTSGEFEEARLKNDCSIMLTFAWHSSEYQLWSDKKRGKVLVEFVIQSTHNYAALGAAYVRDEIIK